MSVTCTSLNRKGSNGNLRKKKLVTNVLEVLYVEMLISFQFDNHKRFGVRNIWLDLNGHDHYSGQKLFFLI